MCVCVYIYIYIYRHTLDKNIRPASTMKEKDSLQFLNYENQMRLRDI